MARIEILDTTLRDGAQAEGVGFSLEDKCKIVAALDALGVAYIEGGNPAANPKDAAFFAHMERQAPLQNAKLCAFGSTRRANTRPEMDGMLQTLRACGAGVITLFGKSSLLHVRDVLHAQPEENLRMIEDSVRFLTAGGKRVIFDAEHFFDGFAQDAPYALETLRAAARGGAVCAVLCDTNGGTLPEDIARVTREAVAALSPLPIGAHLHNDSGTAVAGTLAAVRAGATHVQGTLNGVGERCGNANLCTLLPNLQLKMGFDCVPAAALAGLAHTARLSSEIMNLSLDRRAPYVGRSAFAHKGGMHVDGVLKNPATFEHVPPERVGNQRRLLLSEQAGRAGLFHRLAAIAPDLTRESPEVARLMDALKQREMQGYSYENADGSFALMALSLLGRRRIFYEVLDFHVLSGKPENESSAQAYIKIAVDGREEITAAEGDGPVNALDKALRKALSVFFPQLHTMRLRDFKVRVIDMGGTASTVRVYIESTDGLHAWGTVGVSSNILHACFQALCDSVDFMLTFF